MKRILFLIFFLCASVLLFAQKKTPYLFSYFKGNGEDGLHLAYTEDGFNWKALKGDSSFLTPVLSKDKLMRDPCIVKGKNGVFHMVWTVSWTSKGIGYASSKDLTHWSEQKYIPVMEHEEGARNAWAPEITYDKKKNQYMIYWATTITGRFPETQIAADAGYNHRTYYITTKDFKKFSETRLLYDPGFNSIDATIVKDGRRWIMFFKDETKEPAQKNLKIAFAKKLIGTYSKASDPITDKIWAEGPTILKMGNNWIVYYDKYTAHKYGAIASTDLKNWTDISGKISLPKGIRHGSIFKVSKKELARLR